MTCQHIEPQLNALADRELNPWQAARVRRHLAGCPLCAAEYADIQRFDASVQAWRDVPSPSALGPRIATALPPSAIFQTRRRAFPIRPAAVGLAGAAAAVAAVFWFLPGQPGQPTIAFADVERAMQQVQTVSWVETMEFYNPKSRFMARATHRSRHWLRTNPPALAAFDGVQDLTDAQGERVRLTPGVYADFSAGKFAPRIGIDEAVHRALQEITQPQVGTGYMGYGGTARTAFKFSPVREQAVVYEGQKRVLFVRDQEIIAQRRHGAPNHYLLRISLWADPATRRVVRIETLDLSGFAQGSGSVITRSDFRYNQPPPAGVFDWSIPAGAKVHRGEAAFEVLVYFARHPAKK